MKRLALVVVVALAATTLYAVAAPAGQQAVTPKQFAALQKKVTKLQKDEAKLKKDFNTAAGVLSSCLLVRAVPVAQYGSVTEGYLYQLPTSATVRTTALDVVPAAQQQSPGVAWLITTTPQCATAINQAASLKVLAGLRSSSFAGSAVLSKGR